MSALFRNVALAGLVAIGGYWTLFLRSKINQHERDLAQRDERIGALEGEVAARDERIRELDVALALLKVDSRVGRVVVLDQGPGPEAPDLIRTRVRFSELDAEGEPLGEGVEAVVDGTVLYLEALVIKFDDAHVESGDWLRGTSVCLFQRMFGDDQKPSEGTPIDPTGTQPMIYASDDGLDPFHMELWEDFWDLANDPERAAEKGVRAIHGEAPFMELRPGKSYRVELRASGGLTITAE